MANDHASDSRPAPHIRLTSHPGAGAAGAPVIRRGAADARVEIAARIAAGHFTDGSVPSTDDLAQVKGRDLG